MAVGGIFGSQGGGAWDWLNKASDNDNAYGVNGQEQERDDYLSPDEARKKLNGRKSTPEECETCKNRKYRDGSDEMVSFKAAGHIAPVSAAAVVMGHE